MVPFPGVLLSLSLPTPGDVPSRGSVRVPPSATRPAAGACVTVQGGLLPSQSRAVRAGRSADAQLVLRAWRAGDHSAFQSDSSGPAGTRPDDCLLSC